MDEKDFELLEVLDETRDITHAADKLYMTQSALSKRIKSMEQELGVEILLRSRAGHPLYPGRRKGAGAQPCCPQADGAAAPRAGRHAG